jgi:hypothetical protein
VVILFSSSVQILAQFAKIGSHDCENWQTRVQISTDMAKIGRWVCQNWHDFARVALRIWADGCAKIGTILHGWHCEYWRMASIRFHKRDVHRSIVVVLDWN